jgi:Polyketide cyclase / dehydrase and lipid transport
MWTATYETTTDVSAQKLYDAILDINHWSAWDDGLEFARIETQPEAGAPFTLKPKGGPLVKLTVDNAQPHRLIDTAHLFGGKMRTSHEYLRRGGQTLIRFKIEVWGPLGFFWRKIVGETQIKEAPAQMAAFINYARSV